VVDVLFVVVDVSCVVIVDLGFVVLVPLGTRSVIELMATQKACLISFLPLTTLSGSFDWSNNVDNKATSLVEVEPIQSRTFVCRPKSSFFNAGLYKTDFTKRTCTFDLLAMSPLEHDIVNQRNPYLDGSARSTMELAGNN